MRILTKGFIPDNDLGLLGSTDEVGVTLTIYMYGHSAVWEPGALNQSERIDNLLVAKNFGIRTWASFEPVMLPEATLKMIREVTPFADVIKVGKSNHQHNWDWRSREWRQHIENIDWGEFAVEIVDLLIEMEKPFVLKNDLVKHLPRNYRELYENRPACCWPWDVLPEVQP